MTNPGVRVVLSDPCCEDYFPTDILDVQETLQNYVIEMGENLRQTNKFSEEYTYNLSESVIDNALIYGVILSSKIGDINGKFTLENAILSLTPHFNKKQVNLKFKPTQTGLCRGEIIAVSGKYSNGNVYVDQVFTNCRKKNPESIPETFNSTILVCTGPYINDSLDQIILLNHKLVQINPDFTIFLGPFLTEDCSIIMNFGKEGPCYDADTLTEEVIQILSQNLKNSVFIPSPDDISGLKIIPGPRISDGGLTYSCTGNPCQIRYGPIDIYSIAFQSMDYLIENCCSKTPEEGILAKQCSGYPSVHPYIQYNNISDLKAKRSPHLFIYSGNQEHLEWNGTTSIGTPSFLKSNKITLCQFKDGKLDIQFV
ncbi:hypothetical protein TVAG_292080 [Trichomonas vaginalis G3]|uniref:DNA polymerase alpha subunit B n=1 Tax=Trichomonas vaginalis (strain ATCC PRA-98 / G3) TaxID=412133 RepID=A2DQY8_TRIV3|nr:DNA polymerase 2 alpha 70 kDa subunit family [Trichomonas vaginalis G3]EAY17255.1 hypothetical protein TVAG_292080 [Trichomonas vaginalis G3]KAI5486214.1 DNA polymerase 2 alpha 70 kDa subunit family [Trichomonas vaginalis G3]|eukprot:XP_001329478.1 hypothetical protein [Trichomonas vaginalis G3]